MRKVIPLKTNKENIYYQYLQIWEGIFPMSITQRKMLADCIQKGEQITKETRLFLREKYNCSAQDISNFIQKMKYKKCIVLKDDKLVISPVLFLDLKKGDSEIEVAFKFKI